MTKPVYLSAMGMVCALGTDKAAILSRLQDGSRDGMVSDTHIMPGKDLKLGKVLPAKDDSELSRNNQLMLMALEQIKVEVDQLLALYSADRIGVVLGTSTSGTFEAEAAMDSHLAKGYFPDGYEYRVQEMADPSRFLANYLHLGGPAYTVSTACSSSGKVFSSARNLIHSGVCDAVIAGGVDSLCRLTVHGFSALESVADGYCQPFSEGRNGINLGEGAALFVVRQDHSDIALLGIGESSDAWHISAPHPEGRGAVESMAAALDDAGLSPQDIDYLNLHGTATPLNDAMESLAVNQVFPDGVLASSTKTMTGHTLGAAGAVEAGLAWLLLSNTSSQQQLPPHVSDNARDSSLASVQLAKKGGTLPADRQTIMSNSFAFGGSNVSVILGRSVRN